jgi:eukaryotic translation initiation factor 2C
MKGKVFTIKDVCYKDAKNTYFRMDDDEKAGGYRDISVFDYFLSKYNHRVQKPYLPCVEMTKRGVIYPMDLCYVPEGQRYPFKLNEFQVSQPTWFEKGALIPTIIDC